MRKRMASLNASAMLAAAYEVERHLDRVESMATSEIDAPKPTLPKKIKDIKDEVLESKDVILALTHASHLLAECNVPKSKLCAFFLSVSVFMQAKPVSTNVVIVQDTDVTITGVYVNSTLGSSQEAYCKMQYRVQSSVTEERLVRPTPQEPPKSYTPLSALSCMLPPGTDSGEFNSAARIFFSLSLRCSVRAVVDVACWRFFSSSHATLETRTWESCKVHIFHLCECGPHTTDRPTNLPTEGVLTHFVCAFFHLPFDLNTQFNNIYTFCVCHFS